MKQNKENQEKNHIMNNEKQISLSIHHIRKHQSTNIICPNTINTSVRFTEGDLLFYISCAV